MGHPVNSPFTGESYIMKAFAMSALLCAVAFAQTERGNITGAVTDTTDARIPGATITVTNTATNQSATATTTAAGDYNLPNLQPGTYRVEFSANGFKKSVRESLVVTAAGTIRADAVMEVGQVGETVEVRTDAAQVQTENAKISTAVQNKLVDELPLVVGGALRSPFDLVSITPESRGSGSQLALGGGQTRAWEATLDGVSVGTNRSADANEIAYNAPSLEAITEFTVDTNGFKAEYGQAGGGIMTFSSKSGTNAFHGVAYDFLRNEKLDARGFFAPTRAVYRQNDFGATAGGPIWIPKIYDGHNKTFFFVSYEGFRNRVGSNDTLFTVPTPEMYNGDFSNWVECEGPAPRHLRSFDHCSESQRQRICAPAVRQQPDPPKQVQRIRQTVGGLRAAGKAESRDAWNHRLCERQLPLDRWIAGFSAEQIQPPGGSRDQPETPPRLFL